MKPTIFILFLIIATVVLSLFLESALIPIIAIIATVVIFIIGIQYAISPFRKNGVGRWYNFYKWCHYPLQSMLTWITPWVRITNSSISGSFIIDGNIIDAAAHTSCIHKVVGVGDLLGVHRNSFRLGWKYIDGKAQLYTYCYIHETMQEKKLDVLEPGSSVNYVFSKRAAHIDFIPYGTTERKYLSLPIYGIKKYRFILLPYFGGKGRYNKPSTAANILLNIKK